MKTDSARIFGQTLAKALALLATTAVLGACVSQSVGPDGVQQSAGPFHQSVGPGGVDQGSGGFGPSQSVGPGGVSQSAGSGGPVQRVDANGVQQGSDGTTTRPSRCEISCAGHGYSASCPAGSSPVCQCNNPPYAGCLSPAR